MKLQWIRATCKKCTLYKYLPYTVQCRSCSKKTVNQLYTYSTVLGAAIKCKQYSEVTVESKTYVSVKITLNIFSVYFVTMVTKEPKKKGKQNVNIPGFTPLFFRA